MVKNNIFYFLFCFLLLQVVIKVDTKKCYVRQPKKNIAKIDNHNSKIEVETPGIDNLNNENDLDSEYDSDVEFLNDDSTMLTTSSTIATSTSTETLNPTVISSDTETTETVFVQTSTTLSDDMNTSITETVLPTSSTDDTILPTTSIDDDDLTTTTTTDTIATTTEEVTTTTTAPTKSCIKDSSIICNRDNTLCSLGIDTTKAEILGSELVKITKSSKIINLVHSLEEKYNQDVTYTCSFSNFTQGLNDYRYRSNEADDEFIESFEKSTTIVELYGDIECQPKSLSTDDNIVFTSHVKLESNEPVSHHCSLAGESVKGYSYSPLTAIKVSTFRNLGDDIHIKNGQYILRNNMKNYNGFTEVVLSSCSEVWSLNVNINDDISMDC